MDTAGHSPAEIIGHALDQRAGIALRQFRKNVLHKLLVPGCIHRHSSPYAVLRLNFEILLLRLTGGELGRFPVANHSP